MPGELKVDPRQVVRWAYVFLLGREPESEAAIDQHLQADGPLTLDGVRKRIIGSAEFAASLTRAGFQPNTAAPVGPLDGMLDNSAVGAEGYFTDRFGVRTRVSYLPVSYQAFSGQVGSADGRYDMPLHESEELSALLRSVHDARGEFAAMELGAGWGPWIVLGAHLARRKGLAAALAAVEGSTEHIAFLRTHMTDNGLDPNAHQVIHAVVGTHDGVAYFPRLSDPSANWGAEASYGAEPSEPAAMDAVPCASLATLLDRMPVLDFLHCDVQGAEVDVLSAAIEKVTQRVRRACVGTHSRSLEAKLLSLLLEAGWTLEAERPCIIGQKAAEIALVRDGVQVWRNPRL